MQYKSLNYELSWPIKRIKRLDLSGEINDIANTDTNTKKPTVSVGFFIHFGCN